VRESQAREEIRSVGKSLFDRGYVHAAAGKISVRLPESDGAGYLMTPTDACLRFLDTARLSKLDADGKHVSGDFPSKTNALRTQIYAADLQFRASTRYVIHTHSTHCVGLTLSGSRSELLPAVTPYFVMKVGRAPVIPHHRPGDPACAIQVAHTIAAYGHKGRHIWAVMLERLGPNGWHDSPAAAMAVLEELEETARLVHLSLCAANRTEN
jgi:3-dehydro-4-phosphotetronate decarboxylase